MAEGRPNYEKRRPPQDPRDGKGDARYSDKVGSATDSMESHDVQNFNRQGAPGEPHVDVKPSGATDINPVSIIANYSRLGEGLKQAGNFRKVAMEIAQIAEMAESTVMEEAGDWYDSHTIKRNMNELKKHAGAFSKIAEELDMMQQRASALYDDMGNVLTRYFELSPMQDNDEAPEERAFDPKRARHRLEDPEVGSEGGVGSGPSGADDADVDDGDYDRRADPNMYSDDGEDGESEDDDMEEVIVDRVMERILPERGEETPERAQKALRTPKSFARPHQGITHDQAKQILQRTGIREIGEAQAVLRKVQEAWMLRKESAFRNISESKSAGKVEGVSINLFEGSAVVKVLDAIKSNRARREQYMSMSPRHMVTFAFKLLR